MELEEFKKKILKYEKPRIYKITNSYGVYDLYKWIRKRHWYNIGKPIDSHDFYTIVRQMNKLMVKELFRGGTIKFPAQMGVLEIRKLDITPKIVKGKLKIRYYVDWNSTLKLWFEDEEARANKTVVRFENKYVYFIRYKTYPARYVNKSFYHFTLNIPAKRSLKNIINEGKIDTLW